MQNTIVSAPWLKENIKSEKLIILDASPKGNVSGLVSPHKGQQIVGARPADLKTNFSKKDADFPNTVPDLELFEREAQALGINEESIVVIYDNLGMYSSPRLWWLFQSMGFEASYVLDGGLPEWVEQGGETEAYKTFAGIKGNFKAKFNSNAWRDIQGIENNLSKKKELVIDARSEGRFRGTAPEPRGGLSSGHIPNSKNLPFKTVLNEGKLKEKEELEQMFKNINPGNQPLVFSCGSGLTACITLLAASQVLENPGSVYDGSWTEWAQMRQELVEKG